jgi:hypothetical protein
LILAWTIKNGNLEYRVQEYGAYDVVESGEVLKATPKDKIAGFRR